MTKLNSIYHHLTTNAVITTSLLCLLIHHYHRTINGSLSIKAPLDFLVVLTVQLLSAALLTLQTV